MRNLALGLILSTALVAPALAGDIAAKSNIAAVTVFLQGADVTRHVFVDVPAGAQRIILSDLPADIDPQSVRVEGRGTANLSIASVDTRQVYSGDSTTTQEREALQKEVDNLAHQRALTERALQDIQQQRSFMLSLADKQVVPRDGILAISIEGLSGLVDFVGRKMEDLSKRSSVLEEEQRVTSKALQDAQAKLAQLATPQSHRTEVAVNVEADKALSSELQVTYRVETASWTPYHEARLTTGTGPKSQIALARRAEIIQSSAENWTDVALTLSTARPSGATAAPDLAEQEILRQRPVAMRSVVGAAAPMEEAQGGDMAKAQSLQSDAATMDVVAQQSAANLALSAFQASYEIAGKVSVDNSGQAKKVSIGLQTEDVTLQAVTVPRLDPAAYLTARFILGGDAPLLPGIVNLYRDGTYVGQGSMAQASPGEELKLGFGVDDKIKVDRKEVKRMEGAEGFFTSSNTEERRWDMTVKNLHDFALPLTVVDRVPFSTDKEILVTDASGMTAPTSRDVDKKRGVLAWELTLDPGAEKTITTGYKASWPENFSVHITD